MDISFNEIEEPEVLDVGLRNITALSCLPVSASKRILLSFLCPLSSFTIAKLYCSRLVRFPRFILRFSSFSLTKLYLQLLQESGDIRVLYSRSNPVRTSTTQD